MVYFPNKSESIFTRRKSKLYIFACWMLPLLVMTPSLTGAWGDHKLHCKSRSCTIIDDDENVKLRFKTFIMTLGVLFPTLMLIIFNIMIYARVSKHFKNSTPFVWYRVFFSKQLTLSFIFLEPYIKVSKLGRYCWRC